MNIIGSVILVLGVIALGWILCAFEAKKQPYLAMIANRYLMNEISLNTYYELARAEGYSDKSIEDAIKE